MMFLTILYLQLNNTDITREQVITINFDFMLCMATYHDIL